MTRSNVFVGITPRVVNKKRIRRYLGGISSATYDNWHCKGIVPGAIPGTNRYDIKAHDAALDRCGGLAGAGKLAQCSPLEEWESGHES